MKQAENLRLRKIGSHYMIVNLSEENVNLSEVFTLNETAAMLWQRLGESVDATVESLADWLCEEYEVDRVTALADVAAQIDEWERTGLIRK